MGTLRTPIHEPPSLFEVQESAFKSIRQRVLRPALYTSRGILYRIDCMRLFASLRSDSIDCIFADPPFNLGKDYGDGSTQDSLTRGEYLQWCFSWLDESIRVLKPGGSVFVYILPQWGYHFAAHLEALANPGHPRRQYRLQPH